jgi:uncharacterized membrane protein YraQ (UPF0718 family)
MQFPPPRSPPPAGRSPDPSSGDSFSMGVIMGQMLGELQGLRHDLLTENRQLQDEVRNLPSQMALHLAAAHPSSSPETGRVKVERLGQYISLMRIGLPYMLLALAVAGKLTHWDTMPLIREMLSGLGPLFSSG